jgi:hypothetical protein
MNSTIKSALCAVALAPFLLLPRTELGAQTRPGAPVVDLPLVELPYNLAEGARAPGMQQSLALTSGFYELLHGALSRVAPKQQKKHRILSKVGITAVDFFTIALPFGDAWLHEEWHRAVLGSRGVGSRNDVWNLKNIMAEAISVSHVADADLVRMKREHPADFVRVKAAGIEAEAELITRLERDQFFKRTPGWHVGLYWLIALNDQAYLGMVTSPTDSAEVDSLTIDANIKETTVAKRDVSGHDFTAWVYHLFRQDEPFDARGPHASGVGLDRYIKVSDLTSEEKRFLEREGKLSWLNFLDPNLIGIQRVAFRNPFNGRRAEANLWMRHTLTSFGHSIDAHAVYQQGETRVHFIAQRYTNHERSFPGVRVELLEKPMRFGTRTFSISPRVGVWSQPKGGAFMTSDGSLGGLAGLRIATASASPVQFYLDAEVKSAGWVAGRTRLDRGGSMHTGLSVAFPRLSRP